MNSLLECFIALCERKRIKCNRYELTKTIDSQAFDLPNLQRVAAEQYIITRTDHVARDELDANTLPCIVKLADREFVLAINSAEDSAIEFWLPTANGWKQLTTPNVTARHSYDIVQIAIQTDRDSSGSSLIDSYSRHWFWGVIKRSVPTYRDSILATIAINLFALASPLFVMNVYDRVVPNEAISTLWALAIGVAIVFVFDFVLKITRTKLLELAGKKADILISSTLFNRALQARMDARPPSVGAFASNLREFDGVRNFISSTSIAVIADAPFIFLFIGVIAFVSGPLVIVPIASAIAVLTVGFISQYLIQRYSEKSQALSTQKNALTVEALANIEQLKADNLAPSLLAKWEHTVGSAAVWQQKTKESQAFNGHFAQFMQNITMLGIIIGGTYMISEQLLTMGALIATVMLSSRMAAPVGQFANMLSQFQLIKTGYKSLDSIMQMPEERSKNKHLIPLNTDRLTVELNNATVKYGAASSNI